MNGIEFFKERKIKPKDLVDICQRLKYEVVSAGKNVIQFGEYGDKFFVILSGEVSVWLPDMLSNATTPSGQ